MIPSGSISPAADHSAAGRLAWGILGTGNIARQFCDGVNVSRRSRLLTVGSRSADSAAAFAEAHSIPDACGDYEKVIANPSVEAVYISLPNHLHYQWTIKALSAGKHVLCEKPLAMDAAEAQSMFDAADRAGKVLIEAFMYRAHPLTAAVLQCVRSGQIGTVRMVRASFCYRTMRIAGNIRFDRAVGGGALMDIGCYCINLARLIAGEEPTSLRATAAMHETGVDEITCGMMRFGGGMLGSFTCGMSLHADNTAHLCGTEGSVEIPVPWKPPMQSRYVIVRGAPPRQDHTAAPDSIAGSAAPASKPAVGPGREVIEVTAPGDVYAIEADAFAACVLDCAAPFVTRDDTLGNMRVLDEMRRQIGLQWT